MNGDMGVDIVGGVMAEGTVENSPQNPTGVPGKERKHRGRTSAPLGGRGKFQKRKGGGGGSMSAAASAGAMAGALAASNAAFATLGYTIPARQVSPSPSNHSLSAVPPSTSVHSNSTQSSPRATPSPITITTGGGGGVSQTPPGSFLSVPRTAHTRNS